MTNWSIEVLEDDNIDAKDLFNRKEKRISNLYKFLNLDPLLVHFPFTFSVIQYVTKICVNG